MREIPIFATVEGSGMRIGTLVIDDLMEHWLDAPNVTFYAEDCGPTDVGIHIQSFTANPDRVLKVQVSDSE